MYINRKTFEILSKSSLPDPIPGDMELFECDELIAPIVILINQKGYETLYSCSGHVRSFRDENSTSLKLVDDLYPYILVKGWHYEFAKALNNVNGIDHLNYGYKVSDEKENEKEKATVIYFTPVEISVESISSYYDQYLEKIKIFKEIYNALDTYLEENK